MAGRPALSEYERAIRACRREQTRYVELNTIANAETEAERQRVIELNKSRRGRPSRTARELADQQAEKLKAALALVRTIEQEEGRTEMPEFEIYSVADPTLNKKRGVGHTGRPQNTEIDDIEATIRRIEKRIIAIRTGKEPSGRIMPAEEKISGCYKQISDLEEKIKLLELELSASEFAHLEIRRARYQKRVANLALKALKKERKEARFQQFKAVVDGDDEAEVRVMDAQLNIDKELLDATNRLNLETEKVDQLVDKYNQEFGDIKNEEQSEGFIKKQIRKNEIATEQAQKLMEQRKAEDKKEQTVSARTKSRDDSKIGSRFTKKD